MGLKEILGYICLAGAVVSFVTMYLIPAVNRRKSSGKEAKGEERLIRIEERTGLIYRCSSSSSGWRSLPKACAASLQEDY